MSTILDLYKYAALATASYVRMGGTPLTGEDLAREANAQQGGRIPQVLGTALFNPADASAPRWTILRYYGGDIPAIHVLNGVRSTFQRLAR